MAKYKASKLLKDGARIKGSLLGKQVDKELKKLTQKEIKAFMQGVNPKDAHKFFVLEENNNDEAGATTEKPKVEDTKEK
ncbi:hypothetical protein AB832_06995 [Flavobacteriaceae bacterium (ex Bugula neritina AB1)]|nr:hypothetical protein AB832_06995 [Flavobacteriaceae bacterium (ex Bugula neritina AB1)]